MKVEILIIILIILSILLIVFKINKQKLYDRNEFILFLAKNKCLKCNSTFFSDLSYNTCFSMGEQEYVKHFKCNNCDKNYKISKFCISNENDDIQINYNNIKFEITYTKYNLGCGSGGSFSGVPNHLRKRCDISRKIDKF